MAGLPLRMSDVDTLVMSRFPDFSIVALREEIPHLKIVTERPLRGDEKEGLAAFVESMQLPLIVGFEVENPSEPGRPPIRGSSAAHNGNALLIRPARRRLHAPAFVRADEAFWFEHLNDAATGLMPPERFPGVGPDRFRCYVDLTVGEHVNLRQMLLLYDQMFCSLPLAEGHEAFLAKQGLSEADLLQVIASGFDARVYATRGAAEAAFPRSRCRAPSPRRPGPQDGSPAARRGRSPDRRRLPARRTEVLSGTT